MKNQEESVRKTISKILLTLRKNSRHLQIIRRNMATKADVRLILDKIEQVIQKMDECEKRWFPKN